MKHEQVNGEVKIKTGDKICGDTIISIEEDLFVAGQINIFVDKYDDIGFGDQELRVYRIKRKEE